MLFWLFPLNVDIIRNYEKAFAHKKKHIILKFWTCEIEFNKYHSTNEIDQMTAECSIAYAKQEQSMHGNS